LAAGIEGHQMAENPFEDSKTSVDEHQNQDGSIVLPLYAEEISVSKRVVPKTSVQVARVTQYHEQIVKELLARERVEIERTAIGQPVDTSPEVRQEGDTIVVPIVEEVLTVERRLILKEELRIKRVREEQTHQERVILRKQEAVVKRSPIEDQSRQADG